MRPSAPTPVGAPSSSVCDPRGFSLLEALIAVAILTVGLVSLAHVMVMAATANVSARSITLATILATEKMEQLRSLTFGVDRTGTPSTDLTTNVSVEPTRPTGGRGLSPSPLDALSGNRPGYCDFVDASGRSMGSSARPPVGTRFIRRWSIEPDATRPADALVVRVAVFGSLDRLGRASAIDRVSTTTAVRLSSVRTRKR